MSGFVCLHRDALEHPLLKDPAKLGAWFWMVARAAWKPTTFDVNGKIITLERGQLCVSFRQLSEQWGWPKSTVERFFTRLKMQTMIETDSGTGKMIVTICNYAKYQDKDNEGGTATETPSGTRAGHERDTKEQGNKGTIDNTSVLSLYSGEDKIQIQPESKYVKPAKKNLSILSDDFIPDSFGPNTQCKQIVDGWPPGHMQNQLESFNAHHQSRGTKMANWQLAWKTWVINSEKFRRDRNGTEFSNNRAGPALNPVAQAVIDRRAERLGGKPNFN